MSWRTVVISSRSKLDFKMNYMIIRKDFETTKIYIDEIYMLVIESTAVSLTAVLLNELIKKKVAIVFCDEKRNPASEVLHCMVVIIVVNVVENKLIGLKMYRLIYGLKLCVGRL